jgi:hypothetical protein
MVERVTYQNAENGFVSSGSRSVATASVIIVAWFLRTSSRRPIKAGS